MRWSGDGVWVPPAGVLGQRLGQVVVDLVQQLVEHKHVLEAGVHALTVKGHHGVRGVAHDQDAAAKVVR